MAVCGGCGAENRPDARFCSDCGRALAESPARRARKTVTILFTDLAGSTALGERLDPEALRTVMDRYFAAAGEVIARHGGTVEKFIGDAVLAVFGIPQAREDDALRAVRAAAEMRTSLRDLNKELERDFGVRIQTRTGINTGELLAGATHGGQVLMNADCVNVAARLEQAAGDGEILIGDTTHRLVRDAVVVTEAGPLSLKGKSAAVSAWRLDEVIPLAEGFTRRMDAPLVGRARELAMLHQALERTIDERRCHLFTVLGPPGAGKSRLVREFVDGLPEDTEVLQGRCPSYGDGIAFWPLAEIVRQAAGIAMEDSVDTAADKIRALFAGGGDRHAENLSALVGLGPPAGSLEESFWAARMFLQGCAATGPVVLVVDDIQWARPALLDLIDHIADWTRDAALLLVCLARPELFEGRPSWAGGKLNATSILLEPLSDGETDQMIRNRFGEQTLSAGARARIVKFAGGNPLFVEESLAMLTDEGVLAVDAPPVDIPDIGVPATIDALLGSRLDHLTAPERTALECAAIIGEQFDPADAAALMLPEAPAAPFGSLLRKELVRPYGDGLRFSHALVLDATYKAMPKADRASLHERFGELIEQSAGDRLSEYLEIAAHHLCEAVRYRGEIGEPVDPALARRAAGRVREAGFAAYLRGDSSSAAMLERAVEMTPEGPERAPLLIEAGEAMELAGRLGDSQGAFDQSIRESGDELTKARASLRLLRIRLFTAPRETSTTFLREQLEWLRSVFDREGTEDDRCRTLMLEAVIHSLEGDSRGQLEAIEQAAEHARAAGGTLLELEVLIRLVHASFTVEPMPAVRARCEAALATDPQPSLRIAATIILACAKAYSGALDEARELMHRARAGCEDLGRSMQLAHALAMNGFFELDVGDPERSESLLCEGYELYGRLGERSLRSTLGAGFAHVLNRLGKYPEALAVARESRSLAAEEDAATVTMTGLTEAESLAGMGRVEEADSAMRGPLSSIDNWTPMWSGPFHEVAGRAFALAGRKAEAAAQFDAAVEALDRVGASAFSAAIRRRQVELLGDQ